MSKSKIRSPKIRRRCVIEEAVGETRAAVYEGRKLVELYVRRWSETTKPRTGDQFCGRVRHVDKDMGAAFIDLGVEPDGFLKFTMAPNAPRFQNGQLVSVEVTREAEPDKGPVLKYIPTPPTDKVERLSGSTLQDFIAARFPNINFETAAVNAIEDAVEREIAIPGGGDIAIDFTRALTAIDVDKGPAQSGFKVCEAVIPLIAQQMRLRGMGGLFLIDLPNLRHPKQREQLREMMETAFADDLNLVKIAPMSRFGTVEMTRSKQSLSLDMILNDRFGRPTIETQSLRALRQLEREGRAQSGAQLVLTVTKDIHAWLSSGIIDWKTAMTDRLGARFTVEIGDVVDVKADR